MFLSVSALEDWQGGTKSEFQTRIYLYPRLKFGLDASSSLDFQLGRNGSPETAQRRQAPAM